MGLTCVHFAMVLLLVPLLHASPFGQDTRDSFIQGTRDAAYLESQLNDDDDSKPDFGNLAETLAKWSSWPADLSDDGNGDDGGASSNGISNKAVVEDWPEKRAGRSSFVGMRGRRNNFGYYYPRQFSRSYRGNRVPQRRSNGFFAVRGKRLYDDSQSDDIYRELANAELSEVAKRRLGFTAMRGR